MVEHGNDSNTPQTLWTFERRTGLTVVAVLLVLDFLLLLLDLHLYLGLVLRTGK